MDKNLKLFSKIITFSAIGLGLITVFSTIPGIQLFTTDLGLYIGYALVALSILVALIFPIMGILANPKAAIKSVGGIVALVLIFVISYAISPAEPLFHAISGEILADAGVVQYAGAAIYLGIFIFLAAVVTFLVFEIASIFR